MVEPSCQGGGSPTMGKAQDALWNDVARKMPLILQEDEMAQTERR